MSKQRKKLSDELRRAVDECGVSRYAISKQTGISQSTLSRFVNRERGLPMSALDTLADFLDVHLARVKLFGRIGR